MPSGAAVLFRVVLRRPVKETSFSTPATEPSIPKRATGRLLRVVGTACAEYYSRFQQQHRSKLSKLTYYMLYLHKHTFLHVYI